MPGTLTVGEKKAYEYLKGRQGLVSPEKLAKYFIYSKSHASNILKGLHDKQLLELVQVGKNKFYKIKD